MPERKYRKLEMFAGNTIETAVNELLEYRKKGELVYIDFNGKYLYSDTVTMDDAYKELTGMTKAEFAEAEKKRFDEFMKQQTEHRERIPELTKVWQEKGREVLAEDKWDFWDEIVPIRLSDLYQGIELGASLDIIRILNNNGTFEEAKEMIESQNHSGMSFSLVCNMVRIFSGRGGEFLVYLERKENEHAG